VVAGVLAGGDLQVEPVALSGGGAGAVLRLSPDGRQVRSLTRIG